MTQELPNPKRREFEITRRILEKHGYHSDCSGCDAVLNRTSQRPHSAACRNRLEEEMDADVEDVQRLTDRDVRLRRDTSEDKIRVQPRSVQLNTPQSNLHQTLCLTR